MDRPSYFRGITYLGARFYFRPRLSLSFANSEMVTYQIKGNTPNFIAAMIDRFPLGYGRIVAPTSITFKSENDFQWTSEDVHIAKILIANLGNASAKHIRAGVSLREGWQMIVSPNVEIVNDKMAESSGDHPAYRLIEIPRLNVGEAAVITLTAICECAGSKKPQVSADNRLFLPILPMQKNNDNSFGALLFLTDEDALPKDESSISMKEFLDLESGYFPAEGKGLWATGLTIKKGVAPVIEPLQHLEIKMAETDKDGHATTLTTDNPVPFN